MYASDMNSLLFLFNLPTCVSEVLMEDLLFSLAGIVDVEVVEGGETKVNLGNDIVDDVVVTTSKGETVEEPVNINVGDDINIVVPPSKGSSSTRKSSAKVGDSETLGSSENRYFETDFGNGFVKLDPKKSLTISFPGGDLFLPL
jgi:hypothetical protein